MKFEFLAQKLKESEAENDKMKWLLKAIFEEINLADTSMDLYKRTEQAIKNQTK